MAESTITCIATGESTARGEVALVLYHARGTDRVALKPGTSLTVGRQAPADIVIADRTISRQHARFTWDGTTLEVEDLGSTNGVYVNGKKVASAVTATGDDLIKMGSVRAVIHPLETVKHRGGGQTELIVNSAAMRPVLKMIGRLAKADLPVLIFGETGSGKELMAQSIHEQSARSQGPMVALNCAAIPPSLVESTLFGHEKGAFTGANSSQKGVFEEAHGGTLFLDELGELPLAVQAALLRTLETRRVVRVGSRKETEVDVRLIAATHRNLDTMVQQGEFRQDLLYRLNTVVVEVPPLRERFDDIEPLVRHFLKRACDRYGTDMGLSHDALRTLQQYKWPGNVRELRNEMERAVVLAEGDEILPSDLSRRVRNLLDSMLPPGPRRDEPTGVIERVSFNTVPPTDALAETYKESMERHEREVILSAYQRAGGNQSEAARLLKMPVRTFNHKYRTLCGEE